MDRYDMEFDEFDSVMPVPMLDGDWVKYSDVEAQLKKVKAVCQEVNKSLKFQGMQKPLTTKIDNLLTQLEE